MSFNTKFDVKLYFKFISLKYLQSFMKREI